MSDGGSGTPTARVDGEDVGRQVYKGTKQNCKHSQPLRLSLLVSLTRKSYAGGRQTPNVNQSERARPSNPLETTQPSLLLTLPSNLTASTLQSCTSKVCLRSDMTASFLVRKTILLVGLGDWLDSA